MDVARDLVQDVFIKLYVDREKLTITDSLKSYLFKAVHNTCINWLNQRQTHARHHRSLKDELNDRVDDDLVIQAELEEAIRACIEDLPEACRRIFKMSRYQGKKNKEIAQTLGISVRTVETQISKALAVLRVTLAEFFAITLIALCI